MRSNSQNSSFTTNSDKRSSRYQRDDEGHDMGGTQGPDGRYSRGLDNQSHYASGEDEDRHFHHGHGYVNADNQNDGEDNGRYGNLDDNEGHGTSSRYQSGDQHRDQGRHAARDEDSGYGGGDTHRGDNRDMPSPYAGHERDGHKPDGGYLKSKPTVGKEPPMTPRSSRSGATQSGSSKSMS